MLKSDSRKFFKKKNRSFFFFLLLILLLIFLWSNQNYFYQSSFGWFGGKISGWLLRINSFSLSGKPSEGSIESFKEKNRILLEENATLRENLLKSGEKIKTEFQERFSVEEIQVTGKESFFNQPLLFALKNPDSLIRSGLPVVNKEGFLVGLTDRVDRRNLQIILTPNHRFRIGAKIAGTDWAGVLAGSHDLRSILEMLPLEANPELQASVITDNSNPDIPAEIIIGTVSGVEESADHLFKEALLDIHWKSENFLKLWVVTGRKY